jgi:1-acyl-sn-glycerol-3-phosphate acyltransferase
MLRISRAQAKRAASAGACDDGRVAVASRGVRRGIDPSGTRGNPAAMDGGVNGIKGGGRTGLQIASLLGSKAPKL